MPDSPVQQAIRARLNREPAISKRRLAREIGVKPDTLTGWERGRTPREYQLIKMAPALDVSADDLRATPRAEATAELPQDLADTFRRLAELEDVVPAIKELGKRAPDLIAALEDAKARVQQLRR